MFNRKDWDAVSVRLKKSGEREVYNLSCGKPFLGPSAKAVRAAGAPTDDELKAAFEEALHAALDDETRMLLVQVLSDTKLSRSVKKASIPIIQQHEMDRKKMAIASSRRNKTSPPFYPMVLDSSCSAPCRKRVLELAELEGLRVVALPNAPLLAPKVTIDVLVPSKADCKDLETQLSKNKAATENMDFLYAMTVYMTDTTETVGRASLFSDKARIKCSALHRPLQYVFGMLAAGLSTKDFPLTPWECVATIFMHGRRVLYEARMIAVASKQALDEQRIGDVVKQLHALESDAVADAVDALKQAGVYTDPPKAPRKNKAQANSASDLSTPPVAPVASVVESKA